MISTNLLHSDRPSRWDNIRGELQKTISHSWRFPFVLMLGLLQVAALMEAEDYWTRALMLAHFGLFIIWQPFMRGEKRLNATQILSIAAIAFGILFLLNWWLLALWVSVLAGIVGGKVFLFQAAKLKRFYLVVLVFLVALLLIWIVPTGFETQQLPQGIQLLVQYGLPLLLLVMLLLPIEKNVPETVQIVDFFYAAMLFLLLLVLVLGAFAFMTIGNVGYVTALVYTMLIMAAVLLALSAVWNPRAGFAGLSMYFSRYLLSVGMPFERWLAILASHSRTKESAAQFMNHAVSGLLQLPWVAGGSWATHSDSGNFGATSKNSVEYIGQELRLKVYSRQTLSPSLEWHFQLLGQLISEFYVGKLREQKLREQAYMQAVHETGARLTHDVKNLLQSLGVLCSELGREDAERNALLTLMQEKLPLLTQRLQQTIDKFQKPTDEGPSWVDTQKWWETLQQAYKHTGVQFITLDLAEGKRLPVELFNTAADNLLQNALRKRKGNHEPLVVQATFRSLDRVIFEVADDGSPIPGQLEKGLFHGPVQSESGFGIGLYQCWQMAIALGFELKLNSNVNGDVRFALEESQ